ncbi:hypothetical protein, conserved [Eimeria maxima]|uniref:Uncharacterized protein n=1 Tax=Eimeria maxima TaxID=5804 RepID=U6M6V6_EIMMA|nr:hypothetical protein, conserved [Eimeria maxima]CDJ57405.1 hypothetical protein, conserved [Eimeria maxima]
MGIPLRLTPFGLEQCGVYVQQDRHDEYYEQLLSPSHSRSTRRDCCCVSLLLLGDQNAGKSALLYSLVASRDPRYTALTSLLPIIQGEFSNRREVIPGSAIGSVFSVADKQLWPTATSALDPDCAAARLADKDERAQPHRRLPEGGKITDETNTSIAAVTALERLVNRSRDELPFLDTDVARSAALISAEDFAFFCREFGIQTEQQLQEQKHGLWSKVNASRYVLLHLLEFGGDHLDRMQSFYSLYSSRSSSSKSSMNSSSCCGKCTFDCNCSTCDQASAGSLLLLEQDFENDSETLRTHYNLGREACVKQATGTGKFVDQALTEPAAQAEIPTDSAARAATLAQSLRRSFKLAAEVPVLVYLVNCRTMFIPSASHNGAAAAPSATTTVELSASAFLKLLLRLHACWPFHQHVGNRKRSIHFACSRLSCRSAESSAVDGATRDVSANAAAAGCCCSGFDERESFRRAVGALKAFISITSSASAAEVGASKTVGAPAADAAGKSIVSAGVSLDQPFESLYCCFLRDTGITSDSRITNISWAPFEDCWGVSACAPLKAVDEQLQKCITVVFLKRLLNFVWSVCSPLPFCRNLNFRGVSAVRVLERCSYPQRQQGPPTAQEQLNEAWGHGWQLCVVSVIAFLARMLALLAEAEGRDDASTDAATDDRAGTQVFEHPMVNEGTLPGMEFGHDGVTISGNVRPDKQETPACSQKVHLLQQPDVMAGEAGRQLVSLFSSYVYLHRQQQRQVAPDEVTVDLWVSAADWRDFISDFDPVEQQILQQRDPQCPIRGREQITLPSTGETVIGSAGGGDNLLLLPASVAAGAFTSLAAHFVTLGCCLPCCANGGPWGPIVVQLPVNIRFAESDILLLLLPEVLKKNVTPIQQQLQQANYHNVPLNPEELLTGRRSQCLEAIRLPFHPAVCGLFDSIISSCTRESLPEDFWVAEAAAIVAAISASPSETSVSVAGGADDGYERPSMLAIVRNTIWEAVVAAAQNAQTLLQQRLQWEFLQTEQARSEQQGDIGLSNSLQLLLHLAADVVLLQQMATAAASAKGSQQLEQRSRVGCSAEPHWQVHTGGPYSMENQLFWTVRLQASAAEATEACAAATTNDSAVSEKCGVQTTHSETLKCALESVNRDLAVLGLVLLPARQAIAPLLPLEPLTQRSNSFTSSVHVTGPTSALHET